MPPARIPLIVGPTPLHRLDRVSQECGLDLWIKRDDLTGFAFGGNKGRKLEYLVAEAIRQKTTVLLSCGSAQSNFLRQLAVAGAMFGMKTVGVVMQLPFEVEPPSGEPLRQDSGNVLLGKMAGMQYHHLENGTWDELFEATKRVGQSLAAAGETVFEIPIGGSSPLGAYAFVKAGEELAAQGPKFDWIAFASSSGSTHTGLATYFSGRKTRIYGFACDPEPEITEDFARLSAALIDNFPEVSDDGRALTAEEFELNMDFVGPGYGVPSTHGNAAIRYLAQREGIFLDPIYSGKAFAGLQEKIKSGELAGRGLFWHTGGTPSLFATPSDEN